MLGSRGMVLGGVLAVVGLALAGSGALAEEIEDPTGTVCAGVQEETHCGAVAVAPRDNASCWQGRCTAVSLTGNASGAHAFALTGDVAANTIGVSGTGASGGPIAVSGLGDSTAAVLAVSGAGDSSGENRRSHVAISGLGDSEGYRLAVSGTGDAASGLAAVSGTGATSASSVEVNGMQAAEACIAVSGTGSAESDCEDGQEASGCDTGREAGSEELCRDPDERQRLADAAVCDTDLASSDGTAHAWCGLLVTGCIEIVWGAAVGPIFVGGFDGCQAGVFYDEGGHDHALVE